MRCWCVCLSGARLFPCGPADAIAIPKPRHLLPHLNPDWLYLSGTGLPKLCCKRGREAGVVVLLHTFNGPLSRTTRVSRYQTGKTNLDFTEARDSEW